MYILTRTSDVDTIYKIQSWSEFLPYYSRFKWNTFMTFTVFGLIFTI